MMYDSKFVVAIKSKGNVLKEFKDTVYVKFGSEYSIFLKNLNNKRAIVKISVDGTNVTSDGLVIKGGDYIDLERSIANENLYKGNKFKFIERTDNIEKNRGIGTEDGIIRVEFQFDKYTPERYLERERARSIQISSNYGSVSDYYDTNSRGIPISANYKGDVAFGSSYTKSVNSINDAGITVPGSESNQRFVNVSAFEVEDEKHVIVLRLLGETEQNKIKESVTVKAKQKCTTCGKINKVGCKFCSECGTALEIY